MLFGLVFLDAGERHATRGIAVRIGICEARISNEAARGRSKAQGRTAQQQTRSRHDSANAV